MSDKRKLIRILVVLAAVLVVGGGVYAVVAAKLKVRTIEGTITWLDAAARQAGLEFKHPRKGTIIDKLSTVPADCPITLNGQPAQLADLRVGDRATVRGTWDKQSKQVVPLSVAVTRPSTNASASAPASAEPAARP